MVKAIPKFVNQKITKRRRSSVSLANSDLSFSQNFADCTPKGKYMFQVINNTDCPKLMC